MNTKLGQKFFRISIIFIFIVSLTWAFSRNVMARVPEQTDTAASLSARITENQVHGYGWPLGAAVTLSVNGTVFGPETVVQADWDPNETFVWFDLGETLTLQGGQFIEMTDGIITKSHTVTNLVVLGADPTLDTVFGTADPGTQVDIGHIYCDEFNCYGYRREFADATGNWLADFSVPGEDDDEQDIVDIQPGMENEARQCDGDGDCTNYYWRVPNPHFSVYPVWDSVELWDWPEGALVFATVSGKAECYVEGIVEGYPWGTNLWMDFPEDCDVVADDIVALEAASILTLTHTVRNLSVALADPDTDTVAGTADVGEMVYVWPHWEGGYEVLVVADGSGNWLADFAGGFDLVPGMDGRAEVRDANANATAVDWHIPSPRFTVFPEWETVEAWEWPEGSTVAASVTGKPECVASGLSAYPDWDPWVTYLWLDMPEDCDVALDDVVLLEAEGVDPEMHVVRSLSVAGADPAADTVAGTADAGELVYVSPHWEWGYEVQVTADSSGNWLADYSGGFDILPGMDGRAEVRDENGNTTAVDWHVPNPFIGVRANEDYIEGGEWPIDAILTIEIDDPVTPADPDYTISGVPIVIPEWDPNNTWFDVNLQGVFDIQVGFEITATDGATTKIHQVTPLSIIGIDTGNDTVAGIATPGGWISVWACDEEYCVHRDEEVDSSGNWLADFSIPGENDWEQEIFDIQFDTWIDSQEEDEDSDRTMFGMQVPPPMAGSHDYDQGDVPSLSCNAGGWAMDPDDPEATVAVQILVDGFLVHEITADDYREDLESAWNEGWGGCPNGTCAFEASLWDIVTHYEEHEVTVLAQDVISGDWHPLENTPKPLNCRTYDIYAYDPITNTTTQVTNLRDADEYNPSWSPNGKLVAHDVLFDDHHDIFITDVKTGVSTPLIGAEDGNDAVWSQNGKWIAFDRGPTGDPSIYIVPSEGGVATLVSETAVSADWAPNGKRLVFQDTTDGSIRIVPVDGAKGFETIVAPSGANPSWSPDGNWIAYDHEGDIWKVQVNVHGIVFGQPVQVTSGIFDDQQPTWSADNSTIIYHSGLGRDYDLWSVPAAGGKATWLTGAFEFGDYDPENAKESTSIAYASFSPNGQTARRWVAFFSYDPPVGTWAAEGFHTYHYEWEQGPDSGTLPDVYFNVSSGATLYDGYVLLRPSYLRVKTPGGCFDIDTIHPNQPTRFHIGWLQDGTYPEVLTSFGNLITRAVWDTGSSTDFMRHEVFPYSSELDLDGYRCSHSLP